jgi:glutamine synthetase
MSEQTLNLIKESEAGWVDLRFTDSRGKEQHVSLPLEQVDEACSRTARCSTAPPSPAGRASRSRTWC